MIIRSFWQVPSSFSQVPSSFRNKIREMRALALSVFENNANNASDLHNTNASTNTSEIISSAIATSELNTNTEGLNDSYTEELSPETVSETPTNETNTDEDHYEEHSTFTAVTQQEINEAMHNPQKTIHHRWNKYLRPIAKISAITTIPLYYGVESICSGIAEAYNDATAVNEIFDDEYMSALNYGKTIYGASLCTAITTNVIGGFSFFANPKFYEQCYNGIQGAFNTINHILPDATLENTTSQSTVLLHDHRDSPLINH